MQIVWKGVISFGLVSIPVRLFAATEEHGVSFRQIHATDAGQIRFKRVCTLDGEEVAYSEVAKGYELPDGQVVVLTDADFAELPLASSRAIEVLGFAAADSIDPLQLSRSYYCEPTGSDAKAYVLLREALERTGRVALVKVALRQRESLAVLRPRNRILVLHLLLWPDEIREPRFGFLNEDITLRRGELEAAESYIHALTGTVDPHETVDRYHAALQQLVEAKVAGRRVEQPSTPHPGSVADLIEALRRTVEETKHDRGEALPAGGGEAKRAPAKAATTRQTARKPTGKAQSTGTTNTTTATQTAGKKDATKKTAGKKSTKNR